jgi:hypothetical protein
MSVLFEMGLTDRIPQATAALMLSEIKRTHLPYFFREDAPAGKSADQDAPCPCAFGNIYQILSGTGQEVDKELPWAREWFLKYQMPDGGLSCDEDAYKADGNASSLVGTIAPLEAILMTSRKLTDGEERFLDRGAKCLLDRELRLGSTSQHNAEERLDEADWLKLCFPRFYFYDVLRGLNFVLRWADVRKKPLPTEAIAKVIKALHDKFPDRNLRVERHSFEGVGSRVRSATGEWQRSDTASLFPLLARTSEIGETSPYLTARWAEAMELLEALP